VFIPVAFVTGISGQFYRQFALTITSATVISLIVSLTLSPALCALILKPHHDEAPRWWERPIRSFFGIFNYGYDAFARTYGFVTSRVVRIVIIMLIALCGGDCARPERIPPNAGRFHSAAGHRLSDRRGATAAGRIARAHERSHARASPTSPPMSRRRRTA
jgi:hypothetical protein